MEPTYIREVSTVYRKRRIPKSLKNDFLGEAIIHPGVAAKLFRKFLANETVEKFCVLHLNTKNRIESYQVVSVGTLNSGVVHPRHVFQGAILANAYSVILIHNHPSGDPKPSTEDKLLTNRLEEVGKLVGITVLDHIIIGEVEYYSIHEGYSYSY